MIKPCLLFWFVSRRCNCKKKLRVNVVLFVVIHNLKSSQNNCKYTDLIWACIAADITIKLCIFVISCTLARYYYGSFALDILSSDWHKIATSGVNELSQRRAAVQWWDLALTQRWEYMEEVVMGVIIMRHWTSALKMTHWVKSDKSNKFGTNIV